jgi:hypothetical protein
MLGALLIEAELAIDVGTLMIPAKHEEILWIADFEGKQKAHRLNTLATSIDVVPEEQEVRFWWVLADLEDAQEILVLSMDVSTHVERWLQLDEDGLAEVDLADFLTEPDNLGSSQTSWGAYGTVFDGEKLFDDGFHGHPESE